MVKCKIYTKDGRYFKLDEYKFSTQIGITKDPDGKITSQIKFYNDSVIAYEEIYE